MPGDNSKGQNTGSTADDPHAGGFVTIDLSDETGWSDREWSVDGIIADSAATSFTINPALFSIGPHNLLFMGKKDGVPWSKRLTFTVAATE
jgi:hypothetical protein